ncbi:hypothetical protein F2Q68_00039035 [Brassica cretica]|uniref:Uncharacterized protein n=1 Tax=Brassica cretica TaxID=69181 RepID=A0A8S9MM97_BRACR|nr:hypothetical protein F2Q68_00039035 [Brassica cretica]
MSSSLNFPRPTTKADDLENLYKVYGVDRAVVLDLAGTNGTLETVREGYYGAYISFFHSCGLTFPIPEPILEVLAVLGLSLTQLLPNFLRHLVAFWVKAREEGLAFGLSEFRQLVLVKRNKQNPGTFLVSPRPGSRRLKLSIFSFDLVPSGSSSMSDEIRDLMRALRRGRSNWSTFERTRIQIVLALPAGTNKAPSAEGSEGETDHSQEVVATPSVQTQSSNWLTRQLVRRSSFRTSGFASRDRASEKSPLISIHDSDDEDVSGETRLPFSLNPGSEDETVAATRKRCRSSEGDLTSPSRPRFASEGDGSLFAAQSNLIYLAGRMRLAGCRLPSLASSVEREAYAKVAVASSKVMEAFNEYVMMMADHVVASRNDKEIESIGSEIKRLSKELEATKREGKKDAEKIEDLTEDWRRVHLENEALTSQMVAQRARIAALEVASKKKEVSAEIWLQEVTANIDLLNELRDGGLTVDAELARLKGMEGDCEDLVALAAEVSAEIWLQEVTANIDLLNELRDGGLTVDAELARLKGMEGDCEDLVALAAVPDW